MTAFFSRDETVQRLKEMANIVQIIGEHVHLQKSGSNFKGLCPFHAEKTPSFMVNPVRQSFHCFGCGEGGDVFSFLMLYHRLSFPEALKELAGRYQVELPQAKLSARERERLKKRQALQVLHEKAAEIYHQFLKESPQAEAARLYLEERGIPVEIIDLFRLGFAPDRWNFLAEALQSQARLGREAGLLVQKERGGYYDRFRNRILFPIAEPNGGIVAFGGRILDEGQPKYLNSPETQIFDKSRTLFGLYQNKDAIRRSKQCLLVEGNFDLLALVAHGFSNVAAPLGTALTQSQVRVLKGYAEEVTLLFDGDDAGLKAAMRAVPLFLNGQLPARVAVLPTGEDPDSFLQTRGKAGMDQLLAEARPLSDFVFERLAGQYGLGLEGKGKIISELQPLLKALEADTMQRSLFASHFGQKLGIAPEQLLGSRPRQLAPVVPQKQAGRKITLTPRQRELLEFVLFHPRYLEEFIEAGLDTYLTTLIGPALVDQLRALAAEEDSAPERLLEVLDPGPERSLISELLIGVSATVEDAEAKAQVLLGYWKKAGLKDRKENLIRQLNQATNDETLSLELMGQLQEVNKLLAS